MGTFEIVSNLRELVAEKIEFGENLLKSLTTFEQLDGIQKLRRKIRQEVNFLRKVRISTSFSIRNDFSIL